MSNGIYSLVSRQRLKDMLETLHNFTGLQVVLADRTGKTMESFGETPEYCTALKKNLFSESKCILLHADAGLKAQSLGEAYIFTCHADLNKIAFPLLNNTELLGTVIVGPFLMDVPDTTFISELTEKHTVSPSLALSLYDNLTQLPVLPPSKVNDLKKLIDHLLTPLFPAERMLLLQAQQKAYQQARVNETIQMYKDESASAEGKAYYDKAEKLLEKVRSGDQDGAKKLLGGIIAHIQYSEGVNPENVRMHAQSILALLALSAVESGVAPELAYSLQKHYYTRLEGERGIGEISFCLQEALESFMSDIFGSADNGNAHIRTALRYMSQNYNRQLTLESVAEKVGLSPNYFSSLFRKTVGISFREQLCRFRIEESKRLLLSTDYSLTDIAVAMGFNDQSYYCKVFKNITGLTPGRYRNR